MKMEQTNETNNSVSELIEKVLRICKKGRWIIAFSTLFTVVGANLAVRSIPDKYRSEALILVAEDHISTSFVTPYSTTPLIDRVLVAAREVLSQPRLLEVVQEFNFMKGKNASPDAVIEALRKSIEIEPVSYNAFRISFTAANPNLAHDVTQKLTDLFIERHLELEAAQAESTTSLIEEQLADRRRKLSELELTAASKGDQVLELPDEAEQFREAQARLDIVTANRERATEQRAILQSTLVGNLNAQLIRLRDERAALLKRFTTKHPEVVSKDQQIAEAEAQLEAMKAAPGTVQSTVGSGDPMRAQTEFQLEANALEIANLSKEETRLKDRVAQHQRRLYTNPVSVQESRRVALETKELNEEIADLTKKQQQAGLAASMQKRQDEQQFRLLDPPSLPTHPASRRRQMGSLAALGAGPLLGLVLTFLLDLRRPSFQTENEVRRKFAPPFVLSIPVLPTPLEQRALSRRTGFELAAGSIMVILIGGVEFYAYKLLS
jgi:succinoglycan biosynthesis transport protein ExoP